MSVPIVPAVSDTPVVWTDFSIKIVRFDATYPLEAPDSYVVGFHVMHKVTNRSKYADIRLVYADVNGMTDEDIARLAWNQLKPGFTPWAQTAQGNTPLLGAEFSP